MANNNGQGFLSWALGLAGGVGLWYLLRPSPAKSGPGMTYPMALPPTASPARFANLASVEIRLDQVKTLYRGGYLTPVQALSEVKGLAAAANSFTTSDGERASEVYAKAISFQAEIEDYMAMIPPA
jgi:hypothetical protein